jgi:hypothetical protein
LAPNDWVSAIMREHAVRIPRSGRPSKPQIAPVAGSWAVPFCRRFFLLIMPLTLMRFLFSGILLALMSGCAVVAVADLAVTSVVTVAKVGVKTVGAAVDAVIPDKKSDSGKSKGK